MSKRNRFLFLVSFSAGMAIMAMEISAARLLAPFFGTSIFVWTNVIGIVMAALSIGYWLGGNLADKHPTLKYLLTPMLLAGFLFLIVPWIVTPIATYATAQLGGGIGLIVIGSFFVTALLFALPLLLLGMVSPFVIRLLDVKREHLGSMAGRVFALSTVGSILGTFLPTLLFIPTIGTRATVVLFASLLIVVAVAGLVKKGVTIFAFPLLIYPIIHISPAPDSFPNTIFSAESAYQYIRVREFSDGVRTLAFNEGLGTQSIYTPNNILTGVYYDYFLPFVGVAGTGDQKDIAIIGLAGGTMAREFDAIYGSDVHIDGVEIDPKVIQAAQQFFALPPSVNVINQDGRMFLASTKNTYDLIIVDSYQNELYIPWTMVTREFWQETQGRLNKGGIVAMNVNARTFEDPLLLGLENTLAHVFTHVYLIDLHEQSGWNVILVASDHELSGNELSQTAPESISAQVETVSANLSRIDARDDQPIFTDDWAPVELMTDKSLLFHLKR